MDRLLNKLLFTVPLTLGNTVAYGVDMPGKTVFDTNCKNCHGPNGKGSPTMAHLLNVDTQKMDLIASTAKTDDLKDIVTKGRGKMPSHSGKLKPLQIDQVVAYIESLKSAK